jgi:hypothetical protein
MCVRLENNPIVTPPIFSGIGVASVTIFDAAGDVDAAATADLASQLVELGVRSVFVAGTTGELATFDGWLDTGWSQPTWEAASCP